MKKLILSAAILGLSSTAAFAATDGFYLGGQLGYGDQNYDNHHAFIPMQGVNNVDTDIVNGPLNGYSQLANAFGYQYSSHINTDGLAGRVFGGFQFNPNLAAEVGYSMFSDSKTTINYRGQQVFKAKISTESIDAVGKLIYPISNTGFNVYAKAGAAWVLVDQDLKQIDGTNVTAISSSTDPIRPVFGLGAGYDVTQNLTLDASFTRILGNNNLQNIDFYGAGLTYHFG
jgi:OOP family OmpA-OmpF porin